MSNLPGETHVASDVTALAREIANWLVDLAAAAVNDRGRFAIALAGGSTPLPLYGLLSTTEYKSNIDWANWWCYFGDERACPATDPSSNYHTAHAALLSKVPIAPDHIFRMPADRHDLEVAAADYSRTLETTMGNPPQLDCVLLGLGDNGHTASLFPGDPALDVVDAWCTSGRANYAPFDRLTLTFAAINCARDVAFLVSGANKAPALQGVIAGTVPAASVHPADGQLHWFLDAEAARWMSPPPPATTE